MPGQNIVERAPAARRKGKSPATQAGEFVRDEIRHVREGRHGARSARQAIAIGLSKARRAGIKLPRPPRGLPSAATREKAIRDRRNARPNRSPSRTRARAVLGALKREGRQSASRTALSRQARASARHRTRGERSRAARRAVRTKGPLGLKRAARKAARTRRANS